MVTLHTRQYLCDKAAAHNVYACIIVNDSAIISILADLSMY